MLCIDNIRFWCKIEGLLDRINAPETVLQIIIDDTFALPRLPGRTKQNTTDWQEHEIPPIELAPSQKSYKIQFALYRDGELIGLGRTEFMVNESRKDCLDIVDKQFRVSGKLVYELSWIKGSRTGSYVTYEQVVNAKRSAEGKEVVLAQKIKTERQRKYVRKEGEEDCSSGICACFAVRKKKKTETPRQVQEQPPRSQRVQTRVQPEVMFTPPTKALSASIKAPPSSKFANNPYVYFQQQLEGGRVNDIQQLNRLSFYSKNIPMSK